MFAISYLQYGYCYQQKIFPFWLNLKPFIYLFDYLYFVKLNAHIEARVFQKKCNN